MVETEYSELLQAEIDGELDGHQRAELARRLLVDQEARELREDLLRLRAMLETVEPVDPPPELRANVLRALPASASPGGRIGWPAVRWRYAAGIVLIVGAAALVYETVNGPGPGSAELAAGTIAAQRAPLTLSTTAVEAGPVTGHVSLYRDASGLGLEFELISNTPVDVLIASGGQTQEVKGLGGTGAAGQRTVAVAGSAAAGGGTVGLTFLVSGREVGRAALRVPEGQ
jgi:hypothetical protein